MNFFRHETAVIDTGAIIGDNSKIWHFTHICATAIIGSNCVLGQNVYVGNTVNIGNGVKVQNNVSVYEGVVLEDDVFCGPSAVFTNVYNPRAFIERKNEYRKTVVKKGATLGANCTIVCGVTIGQYAFIGAGAVINEDVPDFALYVGVPGKQVGWVSKHGEQIQLPLFGSGNFKCPYSGEQYVLQGANLLIS